MHVPDPRPASDLAAAAADVRALRHRTAVELERAVIRARLHGHSWAQIGAAADATRQGAWRRWHLLDFGYIAIHVEVVDGRRVASFRATALDDEPLIDERDPDHDQAVWNLLQALAAWARLDREQRATFGQVGAAAVVTS